ncbi:MAG: DUF1365 domain-containing protein [Inquilinus sp.]|nr:DUF1365 domain-containing protein [Inquilinus sp.]
MTGAPPDAGTSALYFNRVMHKRLRPFTHRFDYRVFSLWLDLQEVPRLARRLRLFSHNRFNLFAFHDRDHGSCDGGGVRRHVDRVLNRAGIDLAGGRVHLLCFPRVLGYVFNPLSIYFCRHADGSLRAVLYEVRNTLGDMHSYLLPVAQDRNPEEPIVQACDKEMYVSPFIEMAARYRFRVKEPDERLSILIRESTPEEELLLATMTGRRVALSDATLLRAFFAHPLMTLKVMGAIHWQALWLWLKGAAFHRRPKPPAAPVSYCLAETPEDSVP